MVFKVVLLVLCSHIVFKRLFVNLIDHRETGGIITLTLSELAICKRKCGVLISESQAGGAIIASSYPHRDSTRSDLSYTRLNFLLSKQHHKETEHFLGPELLVLVFGSACLKTEFDCVIPLFQGRFCSLEVISCTQTNDVLESDHKNIRCRLASWEEPRLQIKIFLRCKSLHVPSCDPNAHMVNAAEKILVHL